MAITFRPTKVVEAKLKMLLAERGGTANALLNFLVASERLITPDVQRHLEPPRKAQNDITVISKRKEPKIQNGSTSDITVIPKDDSLAHASSSSVNKLTSEKENKGGLGDGKENPFLVPLPSVLNTPEYIEAFKLFESYRAERRIQKFKTIALKRRFSEDAAWAREYGVDAVVESINKAISKNWQGYFEPGESSPRPTSPNKEYSINDI